MSNQLILPTLTSQDSHHVKHWITREEYLSSDKVNVTMLLLHGWHTLTVSTDIWGNFFDIKDLEKFEMIGMEPAHEVVLYLAASISLRFENVFITYLGSLTFKSNQLQGLLFCTSFQELTSTKQSPVTRLN